GGWLRAGGATGGHGARELGPGRIAAAAAVPGGAGGRRRPHRGLPSGVGHGGAGAGGAAPRLSSRGGRYDRCAVLRTHPRAALPRRGPDARPERWTGVPLVPRAGHGGLAGDEPWWAGRARDVPRLDCGVRTRSMNASAG